MSFHLHDHPGVAIALENRIQRRHANPEAAEGMRAARNEVIAGIGPLQLIGRGPSNLATKVRRALECPIVVHHHASVPGQVNIEFESVRAQRQPVVEGGKGVLGGEAAAATVGEHPAPARREECMGAAHREHP
jgi:hypothetical protein